MQESCIRRRRASRAAPFADWRKNARRYPETKPRPCRSLGVLPRSSLEIVPQYLFAARSQERFRVKLHSLDRKLAMPQTHDDAIFGPSGHFEFRRYFAGIDY